MSARLYSVDGADRNSGQDVHVELRAHSMSHAEMLAINRGILVSRIVPIARPSRLWCGGRSFILWITLMLWCASIVGWSALVYLNYSGALLKYLELHPNVAFTLYGDVPGYVFERAVTIPFFVWLPVALALFIAAVATWRRQAKL